MANATLSRRDDASRVASLCPDDMISAGGDEFLSTIINLLPKLSVQELSQLAMCIIDAIDEAAGDPDIEEDDPCGDHVDEFGEADTPRYLLFPDAGFDPDIAAAHQAHVALSGALQHKGAFHGRA
jgi:hypothetical protein